MKRLCIFSLLLAAFAVEATAQSFISESLVYVHKLHGQTRRYTCTFTESGDTLYLNWGIERNTKWQSGSYAMSPRAVEGASELSSLMPLDGRHAVLPDNETFGMISRSAYKALKAEGAFAYDRTMYRLVDDHTKAMGYALLHVADELEGGEMWILDNPVMPLVWEMKNNPLEINWRITPPAASGADFKAKLIQEPEKMGSVYRAYPEPSGMQTPEPEGYEPFYVSHYGRHGSRWMTSDERYLDVLQPFEEARAKGSLTPLGEDVYGRLQLVWADAKGNGGKLTPLGARQHKAIAERMYMRYPEIFRGGVEAYSSTADRCIKSMEAFTGRLKELNPSLAVTCDSDPAHMDYIAYTTPEAAAFAKNPEWISKFEEFEAERVKPARLMSSLFVDPSLVEDPVDLMTELYWIASNMQDVELDLSFYDIFTPEELFGLWETVNCRMYACNAAAPVNKGVGPESAASLLRNIIIAADDAIASGAPCATLRFGHDTNLIRLLALMQVEGCANKESDPEKFYMAWHDYEVSPMGANLQLVFFRNDRGDILVKALLNEEEVRLPIESAVAPYYSWKSLKNFYIPLVF